MIYSPPFMAGMRESGGPAINGGLYMKTVGIHLVWTTYGTRLPGDPEGHWSPLFDMYGTLIEKGGKLNRPDLTTQTFAQEQMKEPPKILDLHEMTVVADTLGQLLRPPNHKDCSLPWAYAAAIEPNHIHLLLAPINEPIGTVVGRLKGKTSSSLLALRQNEARTRTWTARYWKVFLFDIDSLEAAKIYIEAHNLRRGLAATPYPWISTVDI